MERRAHNDHDSRLIHSLDFSSDDFKVDFLDQVRFFLAFVLATKTYHTFFTGVDEEEYGPDALSDGADGHHEPRQQDPGGPRRPHRLAGQL